MIESVAGHGFASVKAIVLQAANSISIILFDWDGTLADSALLGLAAYQKTFAQLGISFRMDLYEAAYSPNWYSTYEAFGLPQEKWTLADELWNQHYRKQTANLVDGAAETLQGLHQQGYQLGVVTSGHEQRVCREIKASALADIFEVIVCHEHVVKRKPDPEGLELALARLSACADNAAYVGDTPEDILMGKRASILTVGVRSDYPTSGRLLDSAPDIHIESIRDLADHFRGGSA